VELDQEKPTVKTQAQGGEPTVKTEAQVWNLTKKSQQSRHMLKVESQQSKLLAASVELDQEESDCQEIRLLVQGRLSNGKRRRMTQSVSSAESEHLEIGNLRGTAPLRNRRRQSPEV
jgi:hypothetical protein